MSEREVVRSFMIDEYIADILEQDEGYVWRLTCPTINYQQPGPILESLQVHRSISAAIGAAREAYQALPLVVA
tara:strand:+ start:339 stop:557 length:219 start_codon:yes stop_codon:yes gene_type:complete